MNVCFFVLFHLVNWRRNLLPNMHTCRHVSPLGLGYDGYVEHLFLHHVEYTVQECRMKPKKNRRDTISSSCVVMGPKRKKRKREPKDFQTLLVYFFNPLEHLDPVQSLRLRVYRSERDLVCQNGRVRVCRT